MKLFPEIILAGAVSGLAAVVDTGVATPSPAQYGNVVDSIIALGEKFGVMFIILMYFLGRDWLRTKADDKHRALMYTRLDEKDKYIREELANKLAKAEKEIQKSRGIHVVLIETFKEHPYTKESIREHLDDENKRRDEDDDSTDRIIRKH